MNIHNDEMYNEQVQIITNELKKQVTRISTIIMHDEVLLRKIWFLL